MRFARRARRICPGLLAAALALAPAAVCAQEPAESLAARLARAEDAIEQLRAQLQEQAQAKVSARLRNHVQLSGLMLMNAFSNGARVNNSDVPQFVAYPQDSSGLPNGSLGATVRQARVGLTVSGARALGAGLSGDLQLDFFGGSTGGRVNPLLRIRTAAMRLDWPHVGVLVGQESPLVAPLNPVSLAASGFPGYTAAGNLWLWLPQVRVTFETGGRLRFGLQGAGLAPLVPGAAGARFLDSADAAEKSGRPTAQGRLYFGWGDGETESQFGVGLHRGWIATTGDSLLTSEALTVDWRLALGEVVLLHGEAFVNGQALGGLGGGGIGQNVTAAGVPVRTQGGWAQLNIRPSFAWEFGGGYGFDDPDDADLPVAPGSRLRNVVMSGHLHWRPGGGLLTGVEFRRHETTYPSGVLGANHINWFFGVAF